MDIKFYKRKRYIISTRLLFNLILLVLLMCPVNKGSAQSVPESVTKIEDSLLNALTIAQNDSSKVSKLYSLARKLYKYDYGKGIKYINQSIELAERIDDLMGKVRGHFLKGVIFYYTSNYDSSLEELFIALKLNNDLNADWLYATIYNYIGINYRQLKNIEESRKYYEKSLKYYTKIGDKSGIAILNNNIGLLLFDQGKYDMALDYYDKGIIHFDKRPNSIANTTLNIILIHLEKNELEIALQKINFVDSIQSKVDDFLVLTEFSYIKGLYYRAIGDIPKAIKSFKESIQLSSEKNFWNYVKLSSRELSDLYDATGEYKKSLQYYKQFTTAKDSLNNVETRKKIIQLEIENNQDKYLAELKLRENRKQMQYLIYLFIVISICTILGFLYYRQRKKIKQRRKDYESRIRIVESELQTSSNEKVQLEYELIYNKKELAFKNNELVNFALQIIQNDEFIRRIRQKIKVIFSQLKKEENLKMIEELDLFVRQSMNLEKSRNEFYVKTKSLHKTFLYKLKERFPSLSQREIELALLLRLGYSSKEISSLLNISSKSVDMARYRLRKKIKVATNISLSNFFNSFDNNQ